MSTGHHLVPVLDADGTIHGMWTTLPGINAFISVAMILLYLILPQYIRFGLGRGAMIFEPSVMGLYLLVSQSRGVAPPATAVRDRIAAFSASVSPGWGLFLILLLLATLVAASGKLSVRWFENRDL